MDLTLSDLVLERVAKGRHDFDRRQAISRGQTLSGCTSSVAGACQDSENDFSAGSFAGQFVGGGDVRLSRRLSAFGQLRFSLPLEDVGSGDVRFVSGVRVALQR